MSVKAKIKPLIFKTIGTVLQDKNPKIVYYHDILGVEKTRMATPFELFKAHVDICQKNGWTFTKSLPQQKKEIMFFVDDGFRGIWDHHEWLISQNLYPTTSVAIEKIGRPGYLTWEQIKTLHSLGFSFISHTWSHKSLTECSTEELYHELRDSRLQLSDKLGEEVTSICFPRGLFSNKIIEVSAECGYLTGLASIPGNAKEFNCFSKALRILPRNLVQFASPAEFEGILNGAMGLLQKYYAKRHFVNS